MASQSGNIRRKSRDRRHQKAEKRRRQEAFREEVSRPLSDRVERPKPASNLVGRMFRSGLGTISEGLQSIPGGEYLPFVDQMEKLAWGDEFTGMDWAVTALDATDFIPGAAALKFVGIFTPAKTEALEVGIKKGLKESGKYENPSDDLVQAYMDDLDMKYGMDEIASLDPNELVDFGESVGEFGANHPIVEQSWDFSKGGDVDDFKQLEKMEEQHRHGLISDKEMNDFIKDLNEKFDEDPLGEGLEVGQDGKIHPKTGVPISQMDAEAEEAFNSPLEQAMNAGLGKPGYKSGQTIASWAGKNQKDKFWNTLMDQYKLDDSKTLDMVALDMGPGVYGFDSTDLHQLAQALEKPEMKSVVDDLSLKANKKYVDGTNTGMVWVNDVKDYPIPDWYDTSGLSTGITGTGHKDARLFAEEAEQAGLGTDAASRMQRATEQGYQDIGYHHTAADTDFSGFKRHERRGTAVYSNVDATGSAEASQSSAGLGSGERHMPLMLKGKIFGRDRPPDWFLPDEIPAHEPFDVPIQIPDDLKYAETDIKNLWRKVASPMYEKGTDDFANPIRRHKYAGEEGPHPPGTSLNTRFRDEGDWPEEKSWIQPVDWSTMEETRRGNQFPFYEAIKAMGYQGWHVADEAGYSVATDDPVRIRSRFAQFLPERGAGGKDPTGNILAGVGLTAVSLPALMSQLTDIDEDDLREHGFGY